MRIVGVLQNPWFKPGTSERHIKLYQENYEFRKRVLAGSHTGRMLLVGLGEDWFGKIYWTETSFETGNHSGHRSEPDLKFVAEEIKDAGVVIAFGRIAQSAVGQLRLQDWGLGKLKFHYFECPHPAVRLKKSYLNAVREIKAELEKL